MIVTRGLNGKLSINTLALQVFFDDIFSICKNEHEMDFVADNLFGYLEKSLEENLELLD
ncbi:MAG: hypothetical protein RSH78_00015 [Bacilli bacterium]|uniref:hypothetical protein n=1 Tax=Clostridium sp. TaxID=1506 RepID=UPI002FC7047A